MRYRALTAAGDYQLGRSFAQEFLENTPATVGQAVKTSLALIQGEWFLDTALGMPWPTEVLGKGTQPFYDAAIREAILNVQGVTELAAYQSLLNGVTRQLLVQATIDTVYGQISVSGAFGASPTGFGLLDSTFILDLSVLA